MEGLKRSRLAADLDDSNQAVEHADSEDSCGTDDRSSHGSRSDTPTSKSAKKTKGRVRINMEFIDNKLRRYTTFSKRKSGIMKKVDNLSHQIKKPSPIKGLCNKKGMCRLHFIYVTIL